TVASAWVLLLPVARSAWSAVAENEPERVPPWLAVVVMETLACAEAARAPRLNVRVLPLWVKLPWLGLAETKLTPAGRVAVRVTPVAGSGPALLTVTLYVSA